jgi:beta-mannosidase
MYRCELVKDWLLRQEELYVDRNDYPTVVARQDGWLVVPSLPCDVHVPLIDAGVISEPLVADNCFTSEWIEKKSWWFKKTFTAGEELLQAQNSELVIEGLDAHADLFLNGVHLGHHRSAMYPFRKDVRDLLKAGENVLVVRLTSGLEYYTDLDLAKIRHQISAEHKRGRGPRGDERRVFVRKPQYVYGWDWNPRVATCGIMGDARIEAYNDIAVRSARFITDHLEEKCAQATVEVELDNIRIMSTLDVTLQVEILFAGNVIHAAQKEVFAASGLNFISFPITIESPQIWWPNGMGPQNLYTVRISARSAQGGTAQHHFTTGLRTVALNTDRLDPENRLFAFVVNGVQIFAKGGNWETPDCIYGRVSDERYETLVREAREANFNLFRVNGCDAYERDHFYDCCDRYGILIWQDFAFSCAAYPDELDWFRREAENEVDYQSKRLRNHPCLALWCGNNESAGNLQDVPGKKPASPRGALLYNYSMPLILRRNSPHIPYWNSSPYGGETDLESDACGDKHYWVFMSNNPDERISPEEYDKLAGKFVSEFGCIGPSKLSSIQKYLGSSQVEMNSRLWNMHTNPFNTYFYSVNKPVPENNALAAGIGKHYADPQKLPLGEYLLYGGLFQGVMLGYALDSMRCAEHNAGGLIWSYDDAWGEIGWSIIDYYLTRKISYYFVKRALAHKRLAMRHREGEVYTFCMNDSPDAIPLELEHGYMTFDGHRHDTVRRAVTVPPFTKRMVVASFHIGSHDPLQGVYYAAPINSTAIIPAALRLADYRTLRQTRPNLTVSAIRADGDAVSFTISSDAYVHAVHFGFDDRIHLSDEYFDLLPGESRRITAIPNGAPLDPKHIRAGHAGQPALVPQLEQ